MLARQPLQSGCRRSNWSYSRSKPCTSVPHDAGGGPHITRGQLLELAIQFGATLRASGIKPGDTVNVADVNTVCFPSNPID